jgi:hypothetical protein
VISTSSIFEGEPETGAAVFEVLDALGLSKLVKRSGDFGGSVPLRVAQGCAPLFEGNAFGFQITLRQSITVRRSALGMVVEIASPYGEALVAAHRAVLPRLVAQRVIPPDGLLSAAFVDDFVRLDTDDPGHVRVRLWTGLLLRAEAGVWLRVSATANRRNRLIEVEEQFIADGSAFVPLVLNMKVGLNGLDRVRLEGEIGTVAPVAPGAIIDDVSLADAPEIGAAHAAFYDNAYFEAKVDGPTRKYRKMKLPPEALARDAPARCRVIKAGPAAHTIGGTVPHIVFANLVPFEASFDGYTMAVELDERALRAGAREVERTFAEALGPAFLGKNRRAIWYFTKYFTPHPPGEPHFFVKPWAFVQTPPGWSCLLEGVHGEGFDVLRGVVATDMFYATPAVFHVYRTAGPIRVRFGEALMHVTPIPRRLLQARFRQTTLQS